MSMDRGVKTWLIAICMRHSGRAPGSRSMEKEAASIVKTFPEGTVLGDNLGAGSGSSGSGVGGSPDWALAMREDHAAGERDA